MNKLLRYIVRSLFCGLLLVNPAVAGETELLVSVTSQPSPIPTFCNSGEMTDWSLEHRNAELRLLGCSETNTPGKIDGSTNRIRTKAHGFIVAGDWEQTMSLATKLLSGGTIGSFGPNP